MATLYKCDEGNIEVRPKDGNDFSLEEQYDILDCEVVEFIPIGDSPDDILVLDEEGKLKPEFLLTYNRDLSYLAGYNSLGNALLCKKSELQIES